MQRISAQLNRPNSVFLAATGDPRQHRIRTFTPREEVDFAGRAIPAAAHIIAFAGLAPNDGKLELLQAELDKRDGGGLTLRVGGDVAQMIQGTLSVPD